MLNVLVAGGSGRSGIAVARALRQAGLRVFTAGSDQARIEAAAQQAGDGVTPMVCDLADLAGVQRLHDSLERSAGAMDAVIHLVGGWRGASGIEDQSDADWEFLARSAITTLRNVTRVFHPDLASSPTGRFAMVSSTAVNQPLAAAANYAAAKAAAEAWTLAMAEGFSRSAAADGRDLHSAAVVFVVNALVDAGRRKQNPERTFSGATDVEELGAAVVGLFSRPASELNGRRLLLAS